MWRGTLIALTLAACTQLPPTPQDVQAKRFESVPGKAVIYLLRDSPDFNGMPAALLLDDETKLTTHPGTYYRWEVAPGQRRIAGFAGDSSVITLQVEPGKVYYVQQYLSPLRTQYSYFSVVGEQQGRAVVMRSELVTAY